MADVHDGIAADGFAVPLRLHNLLLALAGRLDDTALSEARELTARARLDEAAELIAGALIAGQLPVRETEQHELGLILELSRSDAALADHLMVDDAEADNGVLHRFTGDNNPEEGIADALDRTLQVLPDLRSVHAIWRNTPAGSVPGPLPQRVVLVEIGPEGNPPAAAYRIDAALRRAGIRAVVEVTGPDTERTRYYDQALNSATAVWLAGSTVHSSPPSSPETTETTDQAGRHVAVDAPASPEPVQASSGPGHIFGPREEEPDADRVERTMDLTSAEVAQLRAALAEDDERRGKAIAAAAIGPDEVIEIPELDLDDPQLSERDRQLLRELHAELAERERAEGEKVHLNGSGAADDQARWVDGFSG
ncbi:hypothetical protein [Amycolatopsis taiwanensis]|uniref:Uncharacterized protein n=1 Tax=Amycolatopsis taiwanensis TaxID=342230 RepID=A0A9W6R4B6_9PSEU|nr:hypothetical protein [Amycolatopsis taiwanensis]GLY68641.1 hypothetical protein Atai01_52600 [Amycolatopsis taiwanensis]